MFCRWTCYTRTSVYDVETLWLLLFIISKCCWTTFSFRVRCHKWKKKKLNMTKKRSIQRTVWGPFTFNSLLFANRFSSKCDNWKSLSSIIVLRSSYRGHNPKQNALLTTNQPQPQFILITDRIESRNWPPSPSLKTNRGERQDSWYLDNKVMLAIFFLNTILIYQTL